MPIIVGTKTIYDTPFGRLDMETETKLLLIDMSEDEINVYVEYILYIEGDRASQFQDAHSHS